MCQKEVCHQYHHPHKYSSQYCHINRFGMTNWSESIPKNIHNLHLSTSKRDMMRSNCKMSCWRHHIDNISCCYIANTIQSSCSR